MSQKTPQLPSGILLTALILCLLSLGWTASTKGLTRTLAPDALSDGEAALKDADKTIETAKQNVVSVAEAKTKINGSC